MAGSTRSSASNGSSRRAKAASTSSLSVKATSFGFDVGALAKPEVSAERGEKIQIGGGAIEVRLESNAEISVLRLGRLDRSRSLPPSSGSPPYRS